MKTIQILFALAATALGERSVTLAWDPNAPADMVTRYEVLVDGKLAAIAETPIAQVTIPDAKTTITVLAVSDAGKSDPSAPLVIPASPSNPKGVRVTAILRTTVSTP